MKRTTGILVCTLAAGMAWAQSPEIIQNTRAKMDTVQQSKTAASNEALGIKQTAANDSHAKPSATSAKSSAASTKTSSTTPKATVAPVKVTTVSGKATTTPKASTAAKSITASAKASVAPAKSNTASTKISVAPVKSTTATPKATVTPAKATTAAPTPKAVSTPATSKSAAPFAPKKPVSAAPATKLTVKSIAPKKEAKPAAAKGAATPKKESAAKASPSAPASSSTSSAGAQQADEKASDDDAVKDAQDKKWSMSGKRDPFISPVVSHTGGSGCSTGKKCLEIGAINLRGVVHSDNGFIAVVTNSLNKAYFLRENDPVFDGYVVKITGDSVIFKETMQDRLGKTFTREVVKKLTTPAV
jgi:hypothetical protein